MTWMVSSSEAHETQTLKVDNRTGQATINLGSNMILVAPPERFGLFELLDSQDKTLQLRFFSFTWLVPVLVNGGPEEFSKAMKLLEEFLDFESEQSLEKGNMIWDDHALSWRLSFLLELRGAASIGLVSLNETLDSKIDYHIRKIEPALKDVLSTSRWHNNNHRLFHLMAYLILSHSKSDLERVQMITLEIEDFINKLIDMDTGFSKEQSISYLGFDLRLIKRVALSIEEISGSIKVDPESLQQAFQKHLCALSFPNGDLPSSGDSVLGMRLTKNQLNQRTELHNFNSLWSSLDKLGYHRGSSQDDEFHYLLLSHNAESAHGHHSPLHLDLWAKNFGNLLVDSGGPYKYGDPLRDSWFRAPRAHNSLSFPSSNKNDLKDVSVEVAGQTRNKATAVAEFGTALHKRRLIANDDNIFLIESVESNGEWEIYYHFDVDTELFKISDNEFVIRKHSYGSSIKINVIRTDQNSNLESTKTYRCIGHQEKKLAPSLLLKAHGAKKWDLVFTKATRG